MREGGRKTAVWKCPDNGCTARKTDEKVLNRAFVIAWNAIVDKRDEYMDRWQHMINAGNPLERIRGQQMIDLTTEGKIVEQITEHTTMVLESVEVTDETFTVRLLDGSVKLIKV